MDLLSWVAHDAPQHIFEVFLRIDAQIPAGLRSPGEVRGAELDIAQISAVWVTVEASVGGKGPFITSRHVYFPYDEETGLRLSLVEAREHQPISEC